MRKRLRKKLRQKEFTQFGCSVSVVFKNGLSDDAFDRFVDELIEQAVEANGLSGGGGGNGRTFAAFITRAGAASINESDRQMIAAWLSARLEVLEFELSPLVDAWHSFEPREK